MHLRNLIDKNVTELALNLRSNILNRLQEIQGNKVFSYDEKGLLIARARQAAYVTMGELQTSIRERLSPAPAPTAGRWFYAFVAVITIVLVTTLMLSKCVNFKHELRNRFQYYVSKYMHATNHVTTRGEVERSTFNEAPTVKVKPAFIHSHATSAAARSTASATAQNIAYLLGKVPYMVQESRSDQRKHMEGTRTWYWDKDVTVEPCEDVERPDHLPIHVDSDYYMDMHHYLTDRPRTVMVATFQPEQAAAVRGDYSYTFEKNHEVVYSVGGSGTYRHKIWNYNVDCFSVYRRWFGVRIVSATYLVERRRTSQDHELILLQPVAYWTGIPAMFSYLIESRILTRLEPSIGDYVRLEIQRNGEHQMSTAIAGQYICATIPVEIDNTMCTTERVSKYDLSAAAVECALGPPSQDPEVIAQRKQAAVILTAFHRSGIATPKTGVVFPARDAVRRYQFGAYEEDAKPSLVAFMSPFVHESYAPDKTRGNDQRSVDSRIEAVRADNTTTPFLAQVMAEFVDKLAPVPNVLHPYDHEEVFNKQIRPSQRTLLHQAMHVMGETQRIIKSFVKAESYSKLGDPRMISTINPRDKLEYSRYTYSMASYMKSMRWYAFGLTPRETAQRVADVCSMAKTIYLTDFSRFDGTISPALRDLERMVYLRLFNAAWAYDIVGLHNSQFGLRARTTTGVKYDTGTSRCSGSPETSLLNSTDNAFVTFLSFRMTKMKGEFLSADEAWRKLNKCLFGGDDGLNSDVDPAAYLKACSMLGLRSKITPLARNASGVSFLARVYSPNVWNGDVNSCCDIRRQLSKFHSCTGLPEDVKNIDKLVEKCRGYYMSDKNTPVIGPFVTRVVMLSASYATNPAAKAAAPWTSNSQVDEQYPNDVGSWAQDLLQRQLPQLNLSTFDRFLETCLTLEDCLVPPLLQEPTAPEPVDAVVVLDGQTVHPEKPSAARKQVQSRTKAGTTSQLPPKPPATRGRSELVGRQRKLPPAAN